MNPNWVAVLNEAGERLIADLRPALDDAMLVLGQTGRAWQQEPAEGGPGELGRIEELYTVWARESLRQPLEEWRRRRPLRRALAAFQNYDSAMSELAGRIPASETVSRAEAKQLLGGNAWMQWRWWLRRNGPVAIPARALAEEFLDRALRERGRLDGEIQLILAQAAMLVTDAWESDRRRVLSELAGQEAPDRERDRALWAGRVGGLRDRAASALARYGEWRAKVTGGWTAAIYSGKTAARAGTQRDERGELLDYWSRQQRAVHAFLNLESAVAEMGLECCAESREALSELMAEHRQLIGELDEMAGWLRTVDQGPMPAQNSRLRSAEERAGAWVAGVAHKLRAHLPAGIEVADPRNALPPRVRSPWRKVEPSALFQRSLQESGRPEALEGFLAAESSHLEIVREVERAREVVAFGSEALAERDAEGTEIAREAASNAAQLLDHLRATLKDVGPAAERGLVRGQAAAFLDFHVAIDQGRLGLWAHLTRQRGIRAWKQWAGWAAARARAGSRQVRRAGQDAFDRLLELVGWTPPARPRLDPVVERVDLHRLFERWPRSAEMPRLYRRLFRHEPVEDPRFLIGREQELEGFATAAAAFREGRRTAVIVVGARGSGKTSLLNCAMAGMAGEFPAIRSAFEQRLQGAEQMRAFIRSLLGAPEGRCVREELASGRRVIVLEELERTFSATVGGFEAVRELMSIVEASLGTTMWVFSINETAFAYLDAVLGLGRIFPLRVNAMSVSPSDLRRAILYRHHLSALRLQFAPLARRPASGLRRWLGIEDDPRDVFFATLHDQSEGVFRSALHLWAEAIERVEGGVVFVQQLPEPAVDRLMAELDRTDSFALLAILRHGGLTVAGLDRILADSRVDWQARCDRLHGMGLIEPDPAAAGFRVASLASRAVREMLRRQNLE